MTQSTRTKPSQRCGWRRAGCCIAVLAVLPACFSGLGDADVPFRVGTVTFDEDLPPEPRLPTEDEVCATLEASNAYVKRPDGALPPEADPSPPGASVAADPAIVNPDQARIQAALDACGAAVDAEVGATIAAADEIAVAEQRAIADPMKNISGVSGEELAKPQYRGSKYAVRLVVNSDGPGDSFISGPLVLPSGVTLWVDEGVTLFATRDATAYRSSGRYCANTAVGTKAGASGNCLALINGRRLVNSAVVGDGSIDGRGYSEIVSTDALYPLMKVDLTCSNTYDAFERREQAPDGTPCDNGGTVVNTKENSRNMTWWDLAYLGNMVENGVTGFGHQSNPRIMVFVYVKNLTLYRITLNNSPNFHVVPSGVDGLTVWGVKLMTPTTAAYANPAGNQNPLYTGELFDHYNVKNTDAFDPASEKGPTLEPLTTGSATRSAEPIAFDGYLKNVVFTYNYVSTGDDDIVLKGSRNPSPSDSGLPGIDGNMDVRADRKWGIVIAHNHIYWGHGISIGSETNSGVRNVHIYDNTFDSPEEALRIKSDYARGGEVSNIYYENICVRNALNALLFTPYYSTRRLPVGGTMVPNFHDIYLRNVVIQGPTNVRLEGFEENSGGFTEPAHPLVMEMENVASESPDDVQVISSDAELKLSGVNLPILPSPEQRVVIDGEATRAVDPSLIVDCSDAFVDFPATTSPNGSSWH